MLAVFATATPLAAYYIVNDSIYQAPDMYSVLATRLVSTPPHPVHIALGRLLTLIWPPCVETSSNPQSTASSLRCRHSAARVPASTRDAATTAASSSPTRPRRRPTRRQAPHATPPPRRRPPPASSPTTTVPSSTMSNYRPPRRDPSQRRKSAPASIDSLHCDFTTRSQTAAIYPSSCLSIVFGKTIACVLTRSKRCLCKRRSSQAKMQCILFVEVRGKQGPSQVARGVRSDRE